MSKREVFAVIWADKMLGHLSLEKPDAESAIASAQSIRTKGEGKVENVRAVHIAEGSDVLVTLDAGCAP